MIEPPEDPDLKLLPHRIEWISKHEPQRPYARYPSNPHNCSSRFETVTMSGFAMAINRTAWWLRDHLAPNDKMFAYCGPSDLRWSVLLVGAMKTGRTMVHVSPWIRREALVDLMEACNCFVMLYDEEQPNDEVAESPLLDINTLRPSVRLLAVPSLIECFDHHEKPVATYDYNETWDEAADQNVAIFHTSGITESPRLIVWSNRTVALWHSMLELARRDQSVMVPEVIGETVFTTFMPAHVAGHSFQLFMPMYFGNTIVLRHPSQNLDPETVRQIMLHTSCTSILATPGLIIELTRNRRSLALLRTLDTVVVVGTGLSQESYELLRRPGLTIQNIYGESEVFPLVQQQILLQDPSSIAFHEVSGATFQPRRGSLQELIIEQDNTCLDLQGSFQDWPYYGTYATGDLFRRRSTLPGRWTYEGRDDDRIVLAQGEEIQIAGMEQAFVMHPLVKTALIYGELKPRSLLVIEPWWDATTSVKSEQDKISFLNEIWPDVEAANMKCAEVGRLCRQLTVVMDVPVVTTPQQDVDRKQTLAMLSKEVDNLYARYEKAGQIEEPDKIDDSTLSKPKTRGNEIRKSLRQFHAFREVNTFQW